GTDCRVARVPRGGDLDAFEKRPSRVEESDEAPLDVMARAVAELAAGVEVIAIGLGSPGAIDPETGVLIERTAHLPHWKDFPLRDALSVRVGLPVVVDNDANLAAFAEARRGAARGTRASITVTLG